MSIVSSYRKALSQLQDILKFGVDKLLENDSSSLEAMDFDRMLGLSSDGQWQTAAVTDSTTESSDHNTVSTSSLCGQLGRTRSLSFELSLVLC